MPKKGLPKKTGSLKKRRIPHKSKSPRRQQVPSVSISPDHSRSLLDNSQDVIYRVNLRTNEYEFVSQASVTVLDLAPGELVGHNSKELLARKIHPDDMPGVSAQMESLAQNKGGYMEYRWQLKNGEYRWLANHLKIIFSPDHFPLYRDGVVRDITAQKKAEETIRQTHDFLESLLNYANAPIICWDAQFQVTRFNHAFEHLTGYQAGEVLGRNLDMLFPEDSKNESIAKINRALSGEHWEVVEIPILRKDRDIRIALWNSANVYAEDNQTLLATIAQGQDITERKKKESELGKLNRILKALHNSSQAMTRVQEEITYLEEVCKIIVDDCGYAMVWIGYALEDPSKTVQPMAHAGFDKGYIENLNVTWSDTERGRGPTGTCIRTGAITFCRNMLTDPDFKPWRSEALKRGYASSVALPLLGDNRVLGAITIYSTEPDPFSVAELQLLSELANDLAHGSVALKLRRVNAKAEESLHRHNERLLLLSETTAHLFQAENYVTMMRDMFHKISRHLDIQIYFDFMVTENGDALRLDSYAGIPGEAARTLSLPGFRVAAGDAVDAVRQPIYAMRIQQSDDPKVQWVKALGIRAYFCNPLMAGDRLLGTLAFGSTTKDTFESAEREFMGLLCHYAAMAKERQRLEAELRHQNTQLVAADQRKDQFLAMLAHELRNPLSPIRTSLELIRRRDIQNPEIVKPFETISRQVGHLTTIVNDLMDTSRISRGLIALNKQIIGLDQAISQAVEINQSQFDAKQQKISIALPEEQLSLEADQTRLVQILSNLLNNASKYTPGQGLISLTALRQGGQVLIEVKDSGQGMPQNILPHIFDLFYQADTSLERAKGGLGLGLTLALQLARLHGGTISARSDGPDQGSTFTLSLPLAAPVTPLPAPEAPSSAAVGPAALLKVLIVEDNEDSAESLAEIIQEWGHQACLAFSGPAALEQSKSFQPDVVLLDIGLPVMDGYAVAEKLRSVHAPRALLIGLTGYNPDHARVKQAGFDHYFTKPVNLDKLEQLLRQHSAGLKN